MRATTSRRLTQGLTAAALVSLVAAGSAAGRVHRVRAGETLEGLSRRYGVPVATLARANGIPDPDRIVAGRRLVVPDPAADGMRQVVTKPGPGAAAPAKAAPAKAAPAKAAPAKAVPTKAVATKPVAAVTTAVPSRSRPVSMPPERARLRSLFVQFARTAGVPPDLAMALAWQESGWQSQRVSSTNAVGVMQLMPDTVDFVSKVLLGQKPNLDPRDPAANIRMGTRFLRYLLDRSGGNLDVALASYYQGLRSVREVGPFEETKRFVANVKALRPRF